MDTHLKTIGILNAALGALGLLIALGTLIAFRGPAGVLLINARQGGSASTVEGIVTLSILIYLILIAAPLISVGIGLLRYQEWARDFAVILSIFTLILIPVGTIIGIYNLWVLTSHEVEPLFKNPPSRPII